MAILNVKQVFTKINFKVVENPTKKFKNESGIILIQGQKSEETGNFEDANLLIGFGIVTVVGPDVKTIKKGDGIFYLKHSIAPVPCGEETWTIAEQNVQSYVEAEDPSLKQAFIEYEAAKKQNDKDIKSANFVIPAGFGNTGTVDFKLQ